LCLGLSKKRYTPLSSGFFEISPKCIIHFLFKRESGQRESPKSQIRWQTSVLQYYRRFRLHPLRPHGKREIAKQRLIGRTYVIKYVVKRFREKRNRLLLLSARDRAVWSFTHFLSRRIVVSRRLRNRPKVYLPLSPSGSKWQQDGFLFLVAFSLEEQAGTSFSRCGNTPIPNLADSADPSCTWSARSHRHEAGGSILA
jgi:hypothetical protein